MNPPFSHELTIGMIVKNEAHRLRGCLEGLAQLRQAISCELIITDTGSTDGTKEIAKEFADVYLEFDWCDDFSKARNTATAIAKGRWYIYLDADHTFDESMFALAEFLKSPQSYTPIEAATVSIRNYKNQEGTEYLDSTSCLLHNFSKGRKEFVYPIHECIPFFGNAPLIPVLIHHWGYLMEGEKQNRNEPILLKAIEKDPCNFHHHHHLIRDTQDLALRKQYLNQAISSGKEKDREKDPFYWSTMLDFCQWAWEAKEPVAFAEGKQRLLPTQEQTLLHLELLGMELTLSLELKKTQDLLHLFKEYYQVYHHMQGQESVPFRSAFRYQFISPREFYLLEARIIRYFIAMDQKEEARSILQTTTMMSQTLEHGAHSYLGDYCEFAFSVEGFSILRGFHETLLYQGCLEENNALLQYLEVKFASLAIEEKKNFLAVFSAHPTTAYTGLWALRHSGYQFGKCPSLALKFLEHASDLYTNPLYRDVFYSSFRSGEDRFSFLSRTSLDQLLLWETQLFALDPQCYKLVLQGMDAFGTSHTPLLQRNWGYLGLSALVEAGKQTENLLPFLPAYEKTTGWITCYLSEVYRPAVLKEALEEQHTSLLSPEETFALRARLSLSQTNQKPDPSHPLLALGLSGYPAMKPFFAGLL